MKLKTPKIIERAHRKVKRVLTYKVLLLSIILFSLSLCGIFINNIYVTEKLKLYKYLDTIISTLLGLSIVAVIWELFVKRAFLEEVFYKLSSEHDIDKSGLKGIYDNFKHIDWEDFYSSSHIKLCVYHLISTKTVAEREFLEALTGSRIDEIILPNYKNDPLLSRIVNLHTGIEEDELRGYIKRSEKFIKDNNPEVKIIFTDHEFHSSVYISYNKANLIINRKMNFNDIICLSTNNSGYLYKKIDNLYNDLKNNQ
ncbi:MAG: hypothetical protein Q8880_03980 [Bacteroidota bacterium]|nr:hypothetical protein [Bacteroidota bacterium]